MKPRIRRIRGGGGLGANLPSLAAVIYWPVHCNLGRVAPRHAEATAHLALDFSSGPVKRKWPKLLVSAIAVDSNAGCLLPQISNSHHPRRPPSILDMEPLNSSPSIPPCCFACLSYPRITSFQHTFEIPKVSMRALPVDRSLTEFGKCKDEPGFLAPSDFSIGLPQLGGPYLDYTSILKPVPADCRVGSNYASRGEILLGLDCNRLLQRSRSLFLSTGSACPALK